MTVVRAHLFISGRVQGVGFRWSTERIARREGVTGWVRNRRDGRVEAALEGEREAIERVVAWCRQGPRGARVDDVQLTWEAPTGEAELRIEPTI